eukprot:TRINITY_DN10864_c0_g1_i1.p1 TRINITY_DN10864_c0_g1~~TRINITY_DN10864_c0_g1_i1.p1  ORF type:complete len:691 (-),score=282.05 TRINITY_DN10864_c0_g1_i1:47-2068(-)
MSSRERRMSKGAGTLKAVSAPKTVVHRDLATLLGAELANEVMLAKQHQPSSPSPSPSVSISPSVSSSSLSKDASPKSDHMNRSTSVKSLADFASSLRETALAGTTPQTSHSSIHPPISSSSSFSEAKLVRRWVSPSEFKMALEKDKKRGQSSNDSSSASSSGVTSSSSAVSQAAEALHFTDAELCLSTVPDSLIPLLKPASIDTFEDIGDDLWVPLEQATDDDEEFGVLYALHHSQRQSQSLLQDTLSVYHSMYLLNSDFEAMKAEHKRLELILEEHRASEKEKEARRIEHQQWLSSLSESYKAKNLQTVDSFLRMCLVRYYTLKTQKLNKHRVMVVKELLETETTYVNSLKTLIKVFKVPLAYACNSEAPIVTAEQIQNVFGNVENIWDFHKVWIQKLQERVAHWHPNQRLGDILQEIAQTIEEYKIYSKNNALCVGTIERLYRDSANFRRFSDSRMIVKTTKSLGIAAFVIMPIQRIPRYLLLIKDILKHTHPFHRDYQDLVASLAAINEIAKAMNQVAQSMSNIQRLLEIQDTIIDDLDLAQLNRDLLLEAVVSFTVSLQQGASKEDKKSKGMLYVFNDKVLIVRKESKDKTEMRGVLAASYSVDDFFNFIDVMRTERKKGDEYTIFLTTTQKKYTLIFKKIEDSTQAVSLINQQKEKIKQDLLDMSFQS